MFMIRCSSSRVVTTDGFQIHSFVIISNLVQIYNNNKIKKTSLVPQVYECGTWGF